MRVSLIPIVLAAMIGTTAAAQAFEAQNRLLVVPLGSKDFEVIEARGEGARGMWCAAADYAKRVLKQPGGSRVYVKTPRGPSVSGAGRIGVVFTADKARLSVAPNKGYSVTVRTAGRGLPINHAYQFCIDYLIEPDVILFRLNDDR